MSLAFFLCQEEYFTAYYEAYARMQMELLEASRKREEEIETGEVSAETADRRIGVKSKREELEWKEAPPIGSFHIKTGKKDENSPDNAN